MLKYRYLLLILLITSSAIGLRAQDDEVMLNLRSGYNAALGTFAAVSIETIQTYDCDFKISAGVQYSTIGKTALEACPAYAITYKWGKITPEVLLAYTNMSSVNSFAVGAGVGGDFGEVSAKLGYYYHKFGGKGGKITEPFNIYYELSVHLLRKVENWKMDLIITNNEIFDLERHYQPSFVVECFHYIMVPRNWTGC